MPLVAAAAAAGDVTLEQLGILRRVRTPHRADAFAHMEATFVDVARAHPPAVLARTVRYGADTHDPVAADDAATERP